MSYPPGNPGYPPAQSPGSYGAPAGSSFSKTGDANGNLKHYLTVAVAVLGVIAYLASYFPMTSRVLPNGDELVEKGSTLPLGLVLLAGLLAAVQLLPKSANHLRVITAVSVLGALLVIQDTIDAADRGSGLWIAVTASVVQAGAAIGAALLDAGVVTAPAPRPKYDQYYGQYGGYYGQQQAQQQAPYQQSGYGTQYGGYPSGPNTGGFGAQTGPQQSSAQTQHGSPTPPTGFPSFSPPPSSNSSSPSQGGSGEQGGSGQSYGSGQQPQSPSSPSGPSQS